MVIASYAPSLITFRGDMMRAFQERGHEVVACSPDPDPATLESLAEMGVKHRIFSLQRAGLNPLADLASYRELRRIMAEESPDLVLAYTIKPVIYGCLAAGRAGVPAIHALITGLGTAFLTEGLRARALSFVAERLYRAALAHCRRVFFQNPDDRDLFLNRHIVDGAKCEVVNGSGINLERFPRVDTPAGPPRFLLIARLIADKGIREYARAAALVRERYPDARFSLVGFFENHPRAIGRQEVSGWTDQGLLEFPGARDDVRGDLAACTVFVLPTSYHEGLPRTILEAMATGRAVITTDRPGCRETVADGANGFLIPAGDTEALVEAMVRYCDDPQLAPAHGEVSRRFAEKKFDVHAVNAALISGMNL